MRETWQKPKLIVLLRGRPEEFVLGLCKDTPYGTAYGPAVQEIDCIQNLVNCDICTQLRAS